MSSASPPPSPSCTLIARTGDGEPLRASLSGLMAESPDPHPLDLDQAVQVLALTLSLTPRQAEVLHWMAEGKTNDEIATILACSFHTVKTHTKEIFQRLGFHSRTAAAAAAYRAHIQHSHSRAPSPKRAIPARRSTS